MIPRGLNEWGEFLDAAARTVANGTGERLIEFLSPLQIKNYQPRGDDLLVGDHHIVRGGVFIIGGAPGIGKSRATIALCVAARQGGEWFGLPVHREFKVMIIQTENGRLRLRNEFWDLDCESMEQSVRITPPPPFGLCFKRSDFREQIARAIAEFKPDIVIIDPWISATHRDKSEDYLDTLSVIRSVLPTEDIAPALGIVAHTRKPQPNERANGCALLHMLSGSFTIGAVARSVFVMQAASDDVEDERIVWTCCKNNDGKLGPRSAWERQNGVFLPIRDFDWETFDNPPQDGRGKIKQHHVMTVLDGRLGLTRKEAAVDLQKLTKADQSTCYRALAPDGRFGEHLHYEGHRIYWK